MALLALGHYGDLSHLATNPLTFLPLIETRLAKRGAKGDAIGRVIELKAQLDFSEILHTEQLPWVRPHLLHGKTRCCRQLCKLI
jgi:hypothetical protein